jgi:hypothetical protein
MGGGGLPRAENNYLAERRASRWPAKKNPNGGKNRKAASLPTKAAQQRRVACQA